MKKLWTITALIGFIGAFYNLGWSWPRLGQGANITFQNSGNRASGISVTVSSTSATQVYSSNENHREILLQNTSESYSIHCGTFSAVTATSGIKRWILPKFPTAFATNGYYSIYCIVEPGGSSVEIVGSAEYDSKDVAGN